MSKGGLFSAFRNLWSVSKAALAENQVAGDHGGSAILGFDLSVGGIHAGGYQKTAGSLLGSGDLARRLPDVPDFAFHIRRLDALFDGGHGIIFTKTSLADTRCKSICKITGL